MMKKQDFIKKFLEVTWESGKTLNDLFRYESLSSKMLRMGGYDPKKIFRGFQNLESRGIIKHDGEYFRFTKTGHSWLVKKNLYFNHLPEKWDHKWRIIIFDIPVEFDRERHNFRRKLKRFGLYMIQKSIFVYPYDIIDAVADIAEDLGISTYVDLIIAESIGFKEKEIRKFFGLK